MRSLLFPVWALSLAPMLHAQPSTSQTVGAAPPQTPLARAVDLSIGEAQELALADGTKARVKLLGLEETSDKLRNAVREAKVTVEINGTSLALVSANYRLPVTVAGVQIDCPVTRGYVANSNKENAWALKKDARFRLWPAGSPWMTPGVIVYPARQRWFASLTQMGNEPCYVDGGEVPGSKGIYYHYGLDFGGAEGLVEVVSATDGWVVSASGVTLPEHADTPAKPRADVIYVLDGHNWYYRYSHLQRIDIKVGERVKMGQHLGILGKEGGSGGWSHLHFDITSRQPSGEWGIQDAYAYAWEAYQRQFAPKLIAVARPHHLAALGEKVVLDATRSWSAAGGIASYEWTFMDGATSTGPKVERTYSQPGAYSEILKVTDARGEIDYDFAVVDVLDPAETKNLPPSIHPVFYPTTGIKAGDPVTFKVRSFRNTNGEETWNFGDGAALAKVKSDGNVEMHAKDGYAVTEHRYAKPGHYIVSVERANERGQRAVAHLHVRVEP